MEYKVSKKEYDATQPYCRRIVNVLFSVAPDTVLSSSNAKLGSCIFLNYAFRPVIIPSLILIQGKLREVDSKS